VSTTDISAAPEIARLALSSRGGEPTNPPGSPRSWGDYPSPHTPLAPALAPLALAPAGVTLGALAGTLRSIAAAPERWWGLVRFDPDRSVKIMIEESVSQQAWLVVMPPGDAGQGCDCDAATVIAGQAADGPPASAVLRPGPVRVHGQQHGPHALRGRGAGYSISLHARAHRVAARR
jgi:hypothetical protein